MARTATLSQDDVKRLSGQYDLGSVRRLNLRDMGIGDIEVLRQCTELVALDLRGNSVRSLSALASCPGLVALDVSENGLSGSLLASQLERLPSLTHLNLQANSVSQADDVAAIAGGLPALRVLCLRDADGGRACPVCSHPSYLPSVLAAAPSLLALDGETLALRRQAEELLGGAAADAGLAEEVRLPAAYGERWGRGAAPRSMGARAASSDADALMEVRSTADSIRALREAVSRLSEEDRRGARTVEPILRAARSAKS